MRIQHNIAAINSHRQLTSNNSAVGKNLEKLSSGYKINRAGDDAAGLAISEKMRAQITSLNTATKNANDGISLVQTAEGALTEVHSMLNRMTELAGQAANGTYQNEVDRENAMKELDSLRSEIDRISDSTNYNGIKLLDGTLGGGGVGATGTFAGADITLKAAKGVTLQFANGSGVTAGTNSVSMSGKTITVTMGTSGAAGKLSEADLNKLLKDAGIDATVSMDKEMTLAVGATTTMVGITTAEAKNASVTQGNFRFESTNGGNDTRTIETAAGANGPEGVTIDGNGNIKLSLDSSKNYSKEDINKLLSKGGVTDIKVTDVTGGSAAGATHAAAALTGGAGIKGSGLSLQIGESSDPFNQLTVAVKSMSTEALGIDGLDIGTQQGAKDAVAIIKNAINTVSSTRGDLGAIQNRLEHTINNLGVTAENMTAAESRIRDVDMAQEMMNFTKNNILTQASQAMLAQANQIPQGVLQLLQ